VKRQILVLLLFGFCLAALWMARRSGQTQRATVPAATEKVRSLSGEEASPSPTASPLEVEPSGIAPAVTSSPAPGGEEIISAIISNPNLDFPSAVVRLLETLPRLTEPEQAEAAQHVANLSDEKSAAQWSAMLVAGQLPPAAGEVLFNDLLNRPHDLTMPALAAMADQPYHPKSKDSIAILDVLYGQPPQGAKWAAWIKEKMAEVPR